jgi:glycosyltransferase involved in cell wall biosynthesis
MAGGAARAAYRIHNAVKNHGIDSRMLVKNKTTSDESVIGLDTFEPSHAVYKAFNWVQNKIKNKIQHHHWSRYPFKKEVFMSDLRGTSLHGAMHGEKFDILHLHWINLRFLELETLKNFDRPIVWTLHDCWPFTGVCHYFYDCNKYETSCGSCPMLGSNDFNDLSNSVFEKKRQIYSGCRIHVVTPSRWLGHAARNSALFGQFPVTVIPNPIDTQIYFPGNREKACRMLGLDTEKKIILFGAVNALKDKRKGFHELMAAIAILEKNNDPEGLVLAVFGAEQPPEGLKTRMAVRCLGVIQGEEQMAMAYRAAHVLVSPSLSENLSNVIMESLACGTPVTAFDIGGNSDLIEHKKNGYLAETLSPRDLACGIEWCLENNGDGKLSRHARKKVEESFSMAAIAAKYKELYKCLL